MFHNKKNNKSIIINKMSNFVLTNIKGTKGLLCAKFIRNFYKTFSLETLQEWNFNELCNSAICFWNFIYTRSENEIKLRIYNPNFNKHNWESIYTIIEIVKKDISFSIDTLNMIINKIGLSVNTIVYKKLYIKRNKKNIITNIYSNIKRKIRKFYLVEDLIVIKINKIIDTLKLKEIYKKFKYVFLDNQIVVEDLFYMQQKIQQTMDSLEKISSLLENNELEETKKFIKWIDNNNFIFLGTQDYELIEKNKRLFLKSIPKTRLGILKTNVKISNQYNIISVVSKIKEFIFSSHIIQTYKINIQSTVYRNSYIDYIKIKKFNIYGKVVGELHILGLYSNIIYHINPKYIPFIRNKIKLIIENSTLYSHENFRQILSNIIETFPYDNLIYSTEKELLKIAMNVYDINKYYKFKIFYTIDLHQGFIFLFLYIPEEEFSIKLSKSIQNFFSLQFNAIQIKYFIWITNFKLVRIYFLIKIHSECKITWNMKKIETKLKTISKIWDEDLKNYLIQKYEKKIANSIYIRYAKSFPLEYTENFSIKTAIDDIKYMETLSMHKQLTTNFFINRKEKKFHLKLYNNDNSIVISDIIPIIENLGMKVVSEKPYILILNNNKKIWIHDFTLQYIQNIKFKFNNIKNLVEDMFFNVWFGNTENDGFNKLILSSSLDWRMISLFRTYAKYFKQIGFSFKQKYIEVTLNNNSNITKNLSKLFEIRFNPKLYNIKPNYYKLLINNIFKDLDNVSSLDEDKIIRQYVQSILNTTRTNYYQLDQNSKYKNYISIKLNSKNILGVPKPYPAYEIFIYSPRFEGIHLRCSEVARGGIRWSDRIEDFRTEILDLMKTQQVKNAVIVPNGAKGGFITKKLSTLVTREEILKEGIHCYKLFIKGLLDITDNYKNGIIVKPNNVVCFDRDDPYLVVAADKGTTTFSDIANKISYEYNFWLGDAFASGGSLGYDHKKMGITAKGAWESVKRHFYEIKKDPTFNNFTVVGIGDMSGDVFGNGMLLSEHIKLIGAFNHIHIFIDPNPNEKISFIERTRLFKLSRSTWFDYKKELISKGGGIFLRTAKIIPVSKEMQETFDIKSVTIEPNELIRSLLRAKVDLLWSAGIGTFIKSRIENHIDVGDKANDLIRVNGNELRCKVICEGGNLGLTQLARIEYSSAGGLIYTDFIDNSAGVNCSDREVNIKILLNNIVSCGKLTNKARNKLLSKMTKEISALVLEDSIAQPLAINLIEKQSEPYIGLYSRYISELERCGKLDRHLESLPNNQELIHRSLNNKKLSRPEISILLCYSKILLKEQILSSNITEEPFLNTILISTFPNTLIRKFRDEVNNHPLRREIIATRLSNIIVNEMGFTFIYQLQDETGSTIKDIIYSYIVARSTIELELRYKEIENIRIQMLEHIKNKFLILYSKLLHRLTRWFLYNKIPIIDVKKSIQLYKSKISELKKILPSVLTIKRQKQYYFYYNKYIDLGIPELLAHEYASTNFLFSSMDIISIGKQKKISISQVASLYFYIEDLLDLSWIRSKLTVHPVENKWEYLSKEELRIDLDLHQKQLIIGIIFLNKNKKDFIQYLHIWCKNNKVFIDKWKKFLSKFQSQTVLSYTIFFMIIRELFYLIQSTINTKFKYLK